MSRNGAFELKEGALLICDAHYCAQRPELLSLLKKIATGEIAAPQLILLGDIFDLLFGPISLTVERNREAIDTINTIARTAEVLFFEGNHDFALEGVFENVRVIPLAQQPLKARFESQSIYLAHGDILGAQGYRIYTSIIRNRLLLHLLKWIDVMTNHAIIGWLDRYLSQKNDCQEFDGFEAYISGRIGESPYADADLFVEGHYHQNKGFSVGSMHYFNPAAFACNQRYFIVQSIQQQALLKEVALGKETG